MYKFGVTGIALRTSDDMDTDHLMFNAGVSEKLHVYIGHLRRDLCTIYPPICPGIITCRKDHGCTHWITTNLHSAWYY